MRGLIFMGSAPAAISAPIPQQAAPAAARANDAKRYSP